ncbi:MAG: type IX secretion system sortase PorU [Tannerella sp.]|nr:type IX secretion system sortase PorU [Tannerella sp.]
MAAESISPEVTWTGEKSEATNIGISFSLSQQTSHLDYIRLQMKRRLQPYGACTFFRSFASVNQNAGFTIKNASSNILVFDVTEGNPIRRMETSLNGSELSFTIPSGGLREFAMVDISKTIDVPKTVGEIKSQNLHGMDQTDMIILAPEAFVSEAERLAEFRRTNDHLTVAVVTPEQVYNEFSSGTPEATAIRRFMKMFYDRRTSSSDAPKYLLLFGDGRFDNRKLTDTWKSSSDNYILTYQSKETLGDSSYVSDDYFGFLMDREGANPVTATICIGIGRFPVTTLTQAKNAVDKVISYTEESKSGSWRNKICFVADDGNQTDERPLTHINESNTLADYIENNHPEYIPRKLFFDAFKKSLSGGKPGYPDIRTNIQKELKEGVLIINYTGHGDATSWAEEKVMTQSDINNATYMNLPLWIIAACDFAPFDAQSTSAGEDVFLNKKSGGIALFSTSRVAWSYENFRINTQFMKYLFEKQGGRHLTLGEVMKNSKNDYKHIKLMSYVLLGDPSLTLAYPDEYNMTITEINGRAVSEDPVEFKAFEKITMKGLVSTSENSISKDFNGLLSVTVFDGRQQITTLNNAGYGTFTYSDYPNIIYLGNDSVRNGEFSFTFTVPKDIFYSSRKGKINLYAVDEDNRKEANGSYKNFTVRGTADITEPDESGPEIRALYLNTSDFKDGDKVNETPLLAAIVWDESGINVGSSGIGHDIMLTIDNNPVLSYSLNSYYSTYLAGEEGEGIIKFPVPALEVGKHTAEFKVWDIHNNSSSQTFNFVVTDNYKVSIVELTAGPSPASESVNFMISHDLPESTVSLEIQVYDLNGRLQWKYTESGSSGMFDSYNIKWDLRNGAGARLPSGIYVYRAIMSSDKSHEVSKSKKLIITAY